MSEVTRGSEAKDLVNPYNGLIYIINSCINKVETADLVRVIEVNEDNTVDVEQLVASFDADNKIMPISQIYNVRYFEWQYGANVIKAKPSVGDIGLIIACKRDISNAENGTVGSHRTFNLADGIYIGGICGLNQSATQKIEFTDSGIDIETDKVINIKGANTVNVESAIANIKAQSVNLGGEGGAGIARIGDEVTVGTVKGTITGGSAIVKSL